MGLPGVLGIGPNRRAGLMLGLTFQSPIAMVSGMEAGTVVEYIDRKQIVCAVVLQAKKQKVQLLTESNRETSVPETRLLHRDGQLSPEMGRDRLVASLLEIVRKREQLKQEIDILELWEILRT